MKAQREHRVPLTGRAVEILREAANYADGSGLLFPSVTGRPLSDNTLSKLLRDLELGGTPHGMRSAFRSWCAETNQPRELAEAALAHVVRGVEGSYQRSDVLAARRQLMAEWADYLEGSRSARVVHFSGWISTFDEAVKVVKRLILPVSQVGGHNLIDYAVNYYVLQTPATRRVLLVDKWILRFKRGP